MKTTRFIRKLYDDTGDLLLLNTYTGDLLKIPFENSTEVDNIIKFPNSVDNSQIKEFLVKKNYLINDTIDELARAELKYFEVAHSTNKLLLTILPTEDCNFRCQYCYEEHNVGKMTQNVVTAIKKYVERNLYKYDMLQVNWFGGEPLEAVDIIFDLSKYFISICSNQKKPYRASMTTNGYSLNAELFKKLYALHIVDFQITLDGNENTHNLSRPHKDRLNSYLSIKSNLFDIRDTIKTNNVNITIRTNITISVMEIIDDHLTFLENEFGNDPKFGVIFKIVWSNEKDTEYNHNELLPTGELFNVLNKCVGKKMNFSINRGQICSTSGICYAAHSNAYVFGANGKIYKCTVEYKKDINHIGYINDNGHLNIDKDKWAFWVMKTPFKGSYEKCSSCYFQPACMGVYCPINCYNENGNHICCGMKDYVDIYMKLCAQSPKMVEKVVFNG